MTQTPGRPADGALNPGNLGAGGKIRPTYFDQSGQLGKLMDTDDLDGAIVLSATPVGQSLGLVVQLPDGTIEQRSFNPSTAAGSGTPTFIASAVYSAADSRITFSISSAPSDLSLGDELVFIAPDTLDSATDALNGRDTVQSLIDTALVDVDFSPVRAIDLLPNRIYTMRLLHSPSNQRVWAFTQPLHLFQLAPVQTVTRTITNAELKAIDTTPIELIAAPGAGRALRIESVKRTFEGSDRPNVSNTEPGITTPDPATINTNARLYYGFINTAESSPYDTTEIAEVASGHFTGGFWAEDQTFLDVIGNQSLVENKAFHLAFGVRAGLFRANLGIWYSASAFDLLMTPANDNTIDIEVEYYVRDF